jgi:hypothetical protein
MDILVVLLETRETTSASQSVILLVSQPVLYQCAKTSAYD